MTLTGAERRRQLATAGIGTVLTLVMGAALVLGFRLATQMRANIAALQAASALQNYPDDISQQLATLRDRLETRAYSGQALADLQGTVKRFNQQLRELDDRARRRLTTAAARAAAVGAVPPGARAGSELRRASHTSTRTPPAACCRATVGSTMRRSSARSCLPPTTPNSCRAQLATLAGTLQHDASTAASNLRALLSAGVLAALVLAAAAAYFQFTRSRHERVAREAQEQTRDILQAPCATACSCWTPNTGSARCGRTR